MDRTPGNVRNSAVKQRQKLTNVNAQSNMMDIFKKWTVEIGQHDSEKKRIR